MLNQGMQSPIRSTRSPRANRFDNSGGGDTGYGGMGMNGVPVPSGLQNMQGGVDPPWSVCALRGQCAPSVVSVRPPWSVCALRGQCAPSVVSVRPPWSVCALRGQCAPSVASPQ
jgi:hypothetical protein